MASLRRSFQVKKAGSMCQAEGRARAKPGECRGRWREQKRLGSHQGSGNCKRHLPKERYWALHGPAVGSKFWSPQLSGLVQARGCSARFLACGLVSWLCFQL